MAADAIWSATGPRRDNGEAERLAGAAGGDSVYDSHVAAFTETVKQHERGTFLIQLVSEGDEAYTATIHTPGFLPG